MVAVDIFAEKLEDTVRAVIDRLRNDSMQIAQADFTELWDAVRSYFPEEINSRAQRCLSALLGGQEGNHNREKLARQMSERLSQRTSHLVVDIHNRIAECVHSRNLLVPPGRQATQELIALVEEVSALVRSQGDVIEFVRKNTSQLERIEAEIRRQGMDVTFAADVLTESMVNKLTTRGGLSQFIGGVSTNAGYDAIKNALAALLGLTGS